MKDNDNKEQFIDSLLEETIKINNNKPVEVSPSIVQRFQGILYALLAAFFYTSSIFITNQLNIELLHALVPRFLLQTVMLIIYIKLIKHYSLFIQSKRRETFLLLMTTTFSTTGYFAFFFGSRYLPLPDLTTIRYTQIMWTIVIVAVIYCEKPSIPIILSVLLTIIGVIFVAQPKFLFEGIFNITKNNIGNYHQQHLVGLFIALYSSIALALMIISNKYLLSKYKTKYSIIMFQFTFLSLCIIVIYLFYEYYFHADKIQSLKQDFLNWKYLCASLVCLLQIISSIFIQKSVKREHPSIFTIVQSSDILFSILLQNIFSSIKSNFLSIIGSILVITSILIISGYKLITEIKNKGSTVQTLPIE
ncbi:unnamed protein product [Rotaria sp. Silwood1]|nr:unnamed protein product [Rotaria sp. Silwood1]CAF1605550.1 unnamed protein product [Rotaria sp. Silwood1]CAF3745732.1 unnamed protein product [Rotaria sp. Silwood1]CAF3762847.1 unnamed protein product [Rotaria sp. Silwood1]CAF3822484.1 unnamed protein product [Rotaria sp. Silwood1]